MGSSGGEVVPGQPKLRGNHLTWSLLAPSPSPGLVFLEPEGRPHVLTLARAWALGVRGGILDAVGQRNL